MKKNKLIFLLMILITVMFLNSAMILAQPIKDWVNQDIVGSWETAVYVDREQIVLRVQSDNKNELFFATRSFMEQLGYEVRWNTVNSSINMVNGENNIRIFAWDIKCEKNGEEIDLDMPVFIEDGYSYFHQSFISTVLDMEIVYVDRAAGGSQRAHGVHILTNPDIIDSIRNTSEIMPLAGDIVVDDDTLYVNEVEIIWQGDDERLAMLELSPFHATNGYYIFIT